jgi:hypothetical protein
MRIRLSGTREECQDLLAVLPDLLAEVADVRQVTAWEPVGGGPQRPKAGPAPDGDQPALFGVSALARLAGISTSTIRAYLARGQAGLPAPDVHQNGHAYWSAAAARAWVDTRRRTATTGPAQPRGRVFLLLRPTRPQSAGPATAGQRPDDLQGATR